MVDKERVAVGRSFSFKDADRRVVMVENGQVHWVYIDGKARFGAVIGNQRLKHFANEAIEEIPTSTKSIVVAAMFPVTKGEKLARLAAFVVFFVTAPMIIYWFF